MPGNSMSVSTKQQRIKPLVQEAVHPLGNRQFQATVEIKVKLLQKASLKTAEDRFVPGEA
jgi:hypothetical protein